MTLPTGVFWRHRWFGHQAGCSTTDAVAARIVVRRVVCCAFAVVGVGEWVGGGWGVMRRIVHYGSQCLWPKGHGDAHAAIRYGLFVDGRGNTNGARWPAFW